MASVQYRYHNFVFTAEYLDTRQKFTFHGGSDDSYIQNGHSVGYYGSIDCRFTRWIDVAAYYSEYYPNTRDKDGDNQALYGRPDFMGWQRDTCLSVRFDPLPGWILKLEGHMINGAAQVFDYENTDDLVRRWGLFAAKVTYTF